MFKHDADKRLKIHDWFVLNSIVEIQRTSNRTALDFMSDSELLYLAEKENPFLGEQYNKWNGTERLI